ncbi:metallopeptidase family protein [Peptoniphilus senegalensis]|uniref:metallopeptidase family protein n=1 Tax=Peptoniphilus senegalensis TaxID=1465757 RepID=UPI000319CC8E|nr:metallopeptidase family protein [Peptoniphilus senegalensis]
MLDEDGKKIYISDNENNIEIPIKVIEDFYYKKENDIELSSSDNDKLPKLNEEENLIDETNDENKDDKQEENKEEAGEEQKLDSEDKYDSYYLDRIDEVQEILEEICESIPSYAYEHLNGGIILTEETKFHDEAYAEDLIILGEYQRSILGNMIKIYYGSFMELYRYSSREILKEKLEEVLLHEFTHHLEFLANEWGLVIEDNKFLEEYRKRKQNE